MPVTQIDNIKSLIVLNGNRRIPEFEKEIFASDELTKIYLSMIAEIVWPGYNVNIDLNISSTVYVYTKYHTHGERWHQAESCILQSPEYAYYYAVNIIGNRWAEAEPVLIKSDYWFEKYRHHFGLEESKWRGQIYSRK